MTAYYNEFDPKAAAWLRQLIHMGMIADGIVDDRSITDIEAQDLTGFTQCHFFAGIGVWSYALRNAGWTDGRPVWTASLPCQPFSVAGNQKGKSDERHLLPHFIELVKQCKPTTIFGEQVEAAIRHGWLDDLYTEMETQNYAVGSAIIGAHSVNAPHIRQRIYWGAASNGVSDPSSKGLQGHGRLEQVNDSQGRTLSERHSCEGGVRLANSSSNRRGGRDDIDWLYCRDEKYRPIKSSIKPLVDGVTDRMVRSGNYSESFDANNHGEARTMRLKGYGNAIQAQTAKVFIESFMECL